MFTILFVKFIEVYVHLPIITDYLKAHIVFASAYFNPHFQIR